MCVLSDRYTKWSPGSAWVSCAVPLAPHAVRTLVPTSTVRSWQPGAPSRRPHPAWMQVKAVVVENTFTAVQVGVSSSSGSKDALDEGRPRGITCTMVHSCYGSKAYTVGTAAVNVGVGCSQGRHQCTAVCQPTTILRAIAIYLPPLTPLAPWNGPQDMVSKVVPPLKLLIGTGRPCNFLVTNKWPNLELIPRINKPLLMFVSVQVRHGIAGHAPSAKGQVT